MSDFIHLNNNLNGLPELSKEQNINFFKNYNQAQTESKKKMNITKCIICKKNLPTCNSHSVPQQCLHPIADNGHLSYSFSFTNIPEPAIKTQKGVNAAGTFHLVCNDCDSTFFQPYELFDKWGSTIQDNIMHLIVIKNFLKKYEKKGTEQNLIPNFKKLFNNPIINLLPDSSEYEKKEKQIVLEKLYKTIKLQKNQTTNYYRIVCYQKLPYTVPYAFECDINLITDFDGTYINDYFCDLKDAKLEELHVCVFPLANSQTIILAFYNNNYKSYSKFAKKMSKLSAEEQLSVLNYIIFKYSEDFYMSPLLKKQIMSSSSLMNTISSTPFTQNPSLTGDTSLLISEFDLKNHSSVPNLLSEKYCMKVLTSTSVTP